MKVLITGGAGFIGSTILREVISRGWDPIVVDNLSTGKKKNIPKDVKFYKMNVNSPQLDQVFTEEAPDIVIHEAAQVSVGYSQIHPQADCHTNVQGTANLLHECVKHDVSKFIFASSAAVYGANTDLPLKETTTVKPISFYGLSKLTAEDYIRMFSESFGLKYTILRYANVFGPKQNLSKESGVISIFVNRLIHGLNLSVYGDGEQTRDFVFVGDVARANAQAVLLGDNETINVSTNQQTSLNQLIHKLGDLTHAKPKVTYKNQRSADIKDSFLSNRKARTILQWNPVTNLEEGLAKTLDYYRDEIRSERDLNTFRRRSHFLLA